MGCSPVWLCNLAQVRICQAKNWSAVFSYAATRAWSSFSAG